MSNAKLARALTAQEKQAGSSYGADSDLFHACWQGRANDVSHHPKYTQFAKAYATITSALDSAIQNSILQTDATFYSGYGRGSSVLGSLTGDPSRFVGLVYRYPGFISTSQSQLIAEDKFMRVNAGSGTRPILLEFRLPAGYHALDMHEVGHQGELEYLLPRDRSFNIADAKHIAVRDVEDSVMHLILVP